MALADITPSVDDVAEHLRARTKDKFGNEVGTFKENTRPTGKQVEARSRKGTRQSKRASGEDICEGGDPAKQEGLYEDAKDLAALAVAIKFEREYFPEQVATGQSPYKEMREEFKDELKTLIEAVSEHCGGAADGGDSIGGGGTLPSGSFPQPSCIGRQDW